MNDIINRRISNAELRVAKLKRQAEEELNIARILVGFGDEKKVQHHYHLSQLAEMKALSLENEIRSAKK